MRARLLTLLLLSTLGCARHHVTATVWRFNHCVHNNDHEVCECNNQQQSIDAKTGQRVITCN